jgi:COMPASS component SPP1
VRNGSEAADSENAEPGENGDGTSDEDAGPYCICRGPDNHRFMIACDRCEDWFHGECIGMDKFTGEVLVAKYICPGCGADGRFKTRYRKMCSFGDCKKPARMYGDDVLAEGGASIFCSDEHCQSWWQQLISDLPRGLDSADLLTQETFMGLLNKPRGSNGEDGWKMGEKPFGTLDANSPPSLVDGRWHLYTHDSGTRC